MNFKSIPERAMRMGFGAKIPIKFIGTDVIQDSFEGSVFEQAQRVANLPHISSLAFMPDAHLGIGTCIGTMAMWEEKDALVSPSVVGVDIGCGMRLIRTPLTPNDFTQEALRNLMLAIESRIPMGAGKKVDEPLLDDIETKIAIIGCHAYLKDIIEPDYADEFSDGMMSNAVPGSFKVFSNFEPEPKISGRAWQRGLDTLGTLGGGNHFAEVQVVSVSEPDIAKQWGLSDNQIVIEIHSGSRGFGYQIADDYIKSFGAFMDQWGIVREDRDLVYAPLSTQEGQDYFRAQQAACNFSVLNRLIMSYHVKEALKEVMGVTGSDLCDIIHNYVVKEGNHIVHRKGATAAYPIGHDMIKGTPFENTGFPILIPGSMGTASYILQPLPGANETCFTVNHGAGRRMSRRQANSEIPTDRFENQMSQILVNERNLANIKDEAPDAYKDIDEVIASVEKAGLARVVARCTPIAVMKGSDEEFRRGKKR